MQRRRLLLAFALAAVAALGTFSSASLASTTGGGSSASKAAGLAGPMAAEKSSVEYGPFLYTDERFGPVSCSGKHQTNSKAFPGNDTEGGRDKFTCKSTTGLPLTGTSPEELIVFGPTGQAWQSDYFAFEKGLSVVAITESVSGKPSQGKTAKSGKAYKATIYY